MNRELGFTCFESLIKSPSTNKEDIRKALQILANGFSEETIRYILGSLLQDYINESTMCYWKKALVKLIPEDSFNEYRADLIFNAPPVLWTKLGAAAGKHITGIVMEKDEECYETAINKFGDIVLEIARDIRINNRWRIQDVKDSLQCLKYLICELRPQLPPLANAELNSCFLSLAKNVRLGRENFFLLISLIIVTENFSYQMLEALTYHVSKRWLNLGTAVEFLNIKRNATTIEELGNFKEMDIDRIETNFVVAMLQNRNAYEIQYFMSQLQLNNSVSDEILADSAHRHLIELDMTRQKNPTNHGLIFFSRQSVLIKYFPNYRQNVFDELMKFAVLEPMMDEKQRCVYYTCLAAVCPKKEQHHQNSNPELFKLLFKRLMKFLPDVHAEGIDQVFGPFEMVLHCLYNLYQIDTKLKAVMTEIDPDWQEKIAKEIDFHIVANANNVYNWGRFSRHFNHHERQRYQREQYIIVNTGKLLVYMLGVINNDVLQVEPSFMSPLNIFKGCKLTDGFKNSFPIFMTKTLSRPGGRVPLLHRITMNYDRIFGNNQNVETEITRHLRHYWPIFQLNNNNDQERIHLEEQMRHVQIDRLTDADSFGVPYFVESEYPYESDDSSDEDEEEVISPVSAA